MLLLLIWMPLGILSCLGILAVLVKDRGLITLEDVVALSVLSFLGILPAFILGFMLFSLMGDHIPGGDWQEKVVWRRDKKEKGFTLIEFMIIAAILGILAAVAIPMCSDYKTVKKDRERGVDTESVEYKEWLITRMMGEEYQVPSRKKSRTKHRDDAATEDTSPANPWTHPETGFTCDLEELNCNVLREQYMGRFKQL